MNSSLERATPFPLQVVAALSLIAIDFLLSIVLLLKVKIDVPFTTQLVTAAALGVFYFLWLFGLYRRLNWLRWLTIGGALLGILYLPWAWRLLQSQGDFSLRLLKYVLFDSGSILLCLPQANQWYGRRTATA